MKPETKNKVFWTLVIFGIIFFAWAILNPKYAVILCIIGLILFLSAIPFIDSQESLGAEKLVEDSDKSLSTQTKETANKVSVDNDVTTHPDTIKK